MKKIFSYAAMLLAGLCIFTSCEDDRDSNPTLTQPTTFVLNNPSVGEGAVDLAKSQSINLTWSQPTEYTTKNAPVVATYTIQLSTSGNFTTEYDADKDDNTGADYIALDEVTTSCNYNVPTADIDKALMKLNQWEENAVPASQKLSIRIKSAVLNATSKEYYPILSNVVTVNTVPYYIELKDAPVIMWYLVGNMFGGKWGSDIGETALPMFVIPGYDYDKKTGTGEIEYLNWFGTGDYNPDNGENGDWGWKIQRSDFNWDYGFGGNAADAIEYGKIVYRNGGGDGGHIMPATAGLYTVTVNTKNLTAKMEKYEGTPAVYDVICISGDLNGWGDTEMLPYNKAGVENHAWYYVLEVTPQMIADAGRTDAAQFKFKIKGSWDTNWGFGSTDGAINYNGIGEAGKSNLGLPVGKYCISFNDITGAFSIVTL